MQTKNMDKTENEELKKNCSNKKRKFLPSTSIVRKLFDFFIRNDVRTRYLSINT